MLSAPASLTRVSVTMWHDTSVTAQEPPRHWCHSVWWWTQSLSQMPGHKSGGMLYQNGYFWGIKQTVKFEFNSEVYTNSQRCFKVISLSLMVGKSGNYWKLGIWGFCNWIKSNYEVKLDLDCSETGSIFCPDSIWRLTLVWTWQQGMVLTLKHGGY